MNAYIFICQLIVTVANYQCNIYESTSGFNHVAVLILGTIYGIWNLDFFRYLLPPFCLSNQMSPLHVVTLEYVVAFYPLLLTFIAYVCIQLHARGCRVIVCLCRMFGKFLSTCGQRWGRQWDPLASLLNTFAAFLLLSYSKIWFVSLQLVAYTQLYVPTGEILGPPMRVYHDLPLEWFRDKHLPFALLSVFVQCIFKIINSDTCFVIVSNQIFSEVSWVLHVVEGCLHYMHLLMSSRVATKMAPMVQGTVGGLLDFTLLFEYCFRFTITHILKLC